MNRSATACLTGNVRQGTVQAAGFRGKLGQSGTEAHCGGVLCTIEGPRLEWTMPACYGCVNSRDSIILSKMLHLEASIV